MSIWQDQLQPASYNGLEFGVASVALKVGRKLAIHQYPYRDKPWAEDLGLGLQEYSFRAFVVGDDCYDQALNLINECNVPGPGTLVHPAFGSTSATVTGASYNLDHDRGRMVEIEIAFIMTDETITSDGLTPGFGIDSIADLLGAVGNAVDGSISDFGDALGSGDLLGAAGAGLNAIQAPLAAGQQILGGVQRTINGFTGNINQALGSASRLAGIANGLGSIGGIGSAVGRFSGGSFPGVNAVVGQLNSGLSTAGKMASATGSLIGQAASARNAIGNLISSPSLPSFGGDSGGGSIDDGDF